MAVKKLDKELLTSTRTLGYAHIDDSSRNARVDALLDTAANDWQKSRSRRGVFLVIPLGVWTSRPRSLASS